MGNHGLVDMESFNILINCMAIIEGNLAILNQNVNNFHLGKKISTTYDNGCPKCCAYGGGAHVPDPPVHTSTNMEPFGKWCLVFVIFS